MQKKLINYLIFILIILNFTSCGNQSSSTNFSNIKTGIFIDDVVNGIKYTNNNKTSYTNAKGEFFYTKGKIEFFIGSINIGTIEKVPSDNNVFIQDIIGIDRNNTSNNKVIKIATLLQSLDSDKSTSEIELLKEDLEKFENIKMNIDDINISTLLLNNNIEEKSKEDVISHLNKTTKKYAFNQKEKKYLNDLFHTKYLWANKVKENSYLKYKTAKNMIDGYKYKKLDKWSYSQTFSEYESFATQSTDGFGCYYNKNQIVYMDIGSPCETSGLRRGDYVNLINHNDITSFSYAKAASNIGEKVTFTISRNYFNMDIDITPLEYSYKVSKYNIYINKANNSKVAHFIYNEFSQKSTKEIDTAFDYFKENNVSELVIDLRDNGGGSLYVASYLIDRLLANHVGDIQYTYKFNKKNSSENSSEKFTYAKNSLNLSRIIFLTSKDTASASETIINSLKPYIEVILIGEKTHGKPVGMKGEFISDNIIYWLINFSIENSNNEGDYYDGIDVNYQIEDDLYYKKDELDDRLFNKALYYIKNGDYGYLSDTVYNTDFSKIETPLDSNISFHQNIRNIKSEHIYLKDNSHIIFLDKLNLELISYNIDTKIFKTLHKFLNPIDLASFSKEQKRLYLISNKNISYINIDTNISKINNFLTTNYKIKSITPTNKYLITEEEHFTYTYKYIYNLNGTYIAKNSSYETAANKWDNANNRYYFTSSGISPADLYYYKINQETGDIISNGETPYHGDYDITGPIIVSKDGNYVLLGSGDIYNSSDLTYYKSLGTQINDAIWDNNIVYINSNQIIFKDLNFNTIKTNSYNGSFLKLLKINDTYIIISLYNGKVIFSKFK